MEPTCAQSARCVDETPGFREAIAKAKRERPSRPAVTVTLAQFDDDPVRLYACVAFATEAGVYLTFEP